VTQNPVRENEPTVTVPVTTTLEMPPPKKQRGGGE
jgi:hypothetical protein